MSKNTIQPRKVTTPKSQGVAAAKTTATAPTKGPKVKVGDKTDYTKGDRQSGEPSIAPWQSGLPHRTGKNEDYGFGFDELKMTNHGHELSLRYPKANGIGEVKLDTTQPLDGQIAAISQQMVELQNGPVPEQIDKMIKQNRIVSPFDVDVQVDGKTVNLAKAQPGEFTPDFVNKALFEVAKQHVFKNVRADIAAFYGVSAPVGATVNVSGAKALAKMEKVLERAVELSDQGFGPPLPKDPARREEYLAAVKVFAMKNLFHGENLTTKHQVQGFDVLERNPDLNENMSHDIVDRSSVKSVLLIDPTALEPLWARAWVLEEIQQQSPAEYQKLTGGGAPNDVAAKVDPKQLSALAMQHPEWTVNPNAGESRYVLAMYHWGDERNDADSMMHWHRAANHHDGDLEAGTLLLEQKRQNGVEHHAGTEHEGVRHEVGLGYDGALPFERTIRKIWADSAFRNPFWRTAAMKDIVFQRILQERGIVTPEDLQRSPNPDAYLRLDHAYQTLQQANTNADKGLRTLAPLVAFAGKLKAEIDQVTVASAPAVFEKVAAAAAKAKGPDATALWQYLQATMIQKSGISVEATKGFMPLADRARDAVAALGGKPPVSLATLKLTEALELRTQLLELKAAAQEARAGGDSSLAVVYEMWNDIANGGFVSQAH